MIYPYLGIGKIGRVPIADPSSEVKILGITME